jgi:hypothetical protein
MVTHYGLCLEVKFDHANVAFVDERFALTEWDEGALHKSKTPDRALRSNALFVRFLVLVLSIAVLVLVLEVT